MITVTLLGLAFGWHASNKKISGNNGAVQASSSEIVVGYTAYSYNINQRAVVTSDSITALTFQQYDLIFASGNRFTPVVIRAEITGGYDLPESGVVTFTIRRDTSREDNPTTSDRAFGLLLERDEIHRRRRRRDL